MKIYLNTADSALTMDILKKHYILYDKKLKKIENGNIKFEIEEEGNSNYIEFSVDLLCLYNKEYFYDKFSKGIFCYFKLVIEENYLHQFVEKVS